MTNDESIPDLDLDGADRDATQLKGEHKPIAERAAQQHHRRQHQRPARASKRMIYKRGGGKKR